MGRNRTETTLGSGQIGGRYVFRYSDEEDGQDAQQKFIEDMSRAISGETPVTEGEQTGWLMIGAMKMGTTIPIKSALGAPLFRLTIEPVAGATQEFNSQGNYMVLLKRGEDGTVEKLMVDFTTEMPYSNQPTFTAKETKLAIDALVKMGLMKRKP
jgi:hypothetical protein